MKLIKRTAYLNELNSLSNTPDIKVITGVRRSGKSKLLEKSAEETGKKDKSANIIHINYNLTEFEEQLEYHALEKYVEGKYKNLKFIADAIGNKGDTSRAVIRNYFLDDYYKDHCNTYSVTGSGKRPIYWLFDSGKQNGFKVLIYIHRYTPDTVGLIRSVYLHNAQAAIQNSLQNSEYIIATTTSATERARETRKRDKYVKQLKELRPYYQALSHIALQHIPMDLDDGVKKNYQLFQGVEVSTEGKKKQTIDLLAKL